MDFEEEMKMIRNRNSKCRQLDNAAKIFPAVSDKRDERVFRFVCELKEEVDPLILQVALDESIKIFPMFLCVIRKGFFWNYMEERDIRPLVTEENMPPCSGIYVRDQRNLLFRVTYYKKRINFEVFHALTDGTGALQFLKTLVHYYLKLVHPDEVNEPIYSYDATYTEKEEDSFKKYYKKVDKTIKIPKYRSFQLGGRKLDVGNMGIIEGKLSVSEVLKISREYNTTMTVLLTAIYLAAIEKEIGPRHKQKTATLMVPVNLRNYFPSASASNFFGWINVGYDFGVRGKELPEIISYVSEFFKKELTTERLAVRVNDFVKLEENILARLLPLEIKNFGMKMGSKVKRYAVTAIFSNIGKVEMPEECSPYIELFDIFISTPKMQLCMCSFNDQLVLNFTSVYESTNVQRNFFRILSGLGLQVEISARDSQ